MRHTGTTPKGLRVFEGRFVETKRPTAKGKGKDGTYRDLGLARALREEQRKLQERRIARQARMMQEVQPTEFPTLDNLVKGDSDVS